MAQLFDLARNILKSNGSKITLAFIGDSIVIFRE